MAGISKKELEQITDFVYEMGIHARTPRSGLWFLGSGEQSVAEHLFRVAMIAYALCYLTPKADKNKVLFMALVHDIGEGRVSDLNYVHQKYGRLAEQQAVEDIARGVPFGKEIEESYKEEQAKKTVEAKLVKDADKLEWIATLRAEEEKGNAKAKKWAASAFKALMTPAGKAIGEKLLKTHPDNWWFDENDKWFIHRDPSDRKWK
ncbi:MAG: HD domain-containing protein [bacterium]|nr:HD domain-containing protein [bacterium]